MSENPKEPISEEKESDLLPKADYITRAGGIFAVELLMKEKCEMPSDEQFIKILSKHLGNIEQLGDRQNSISFIAKDYISEFEDKSVPVMLMITDCDEFESEKIDDFKRSQMWDCSESVLSELKFSVMAADSLGGGLPSKVRADMLMDYLEALVELYPSCEAVYMSNTGKLIKADEIRKKELQGVSRYIHYFVNVRLFNIMNTNDKVIDTIGLGLLFIEDLQYYYHDMDPNYVVHHAYSMASYILENDNPIKNGDTIDGIRDGRLAQDIQWKCIYEGSMIQPERPVIDICMGEYASGERD